MITMLAENLWVAPNKGAPSWLKYWKWLKMVNLNVSQNTIIYKQLIYSLRPILINLCTLIPKIINILSENVLLQGCTKLAEILKMSENGIFRYFPKLHHIKAVNIFSQTYFHTFVDADSKNDNHVGWKFMVSPQQGGTKLAEILKMTENGQFECFPKHHHI